MCIRPSSKARQPSPSGRCFTAPDEEQTVASVCATGNGLRWLLMLVLLCSAFCGPRESLAGEIAINEIHYAPDNKTEQVEFVELYNPASAPADLSDWELSGGVQFKLPSGVKIESGGYVVIAQNPAALRAKFSRFGITNALGPWVGKLANEGDKVVLRDGTGAVVDTVEYQLGFPWPTVGDAPGYSIELINPALDNDLGGSWRASGLGGPVEEFQTLFQPFGPWRYFKGTREASEPASAWRQPEFDDSGWLTGRAPIGFGESFIRTRLNDMATNYTSVFLRADFQIEDLAKVTEVMVFAQYDDGFKLWINGINVLNENISADEVPFNGTANASLETNPDFTQLRGIAPESYLVEGRNTIAVQAHNASPESNDFFFDFAIIAVSAPVLQGPTPGQKNWAFAEIAPPQVRQVRHEPEQPVTGQPVKITAKVTDPDGVAHVTMEYQVVEPGSYIELTDAAYQTNWTSLPMSDAGDESDGLAGDGIYSVSIPARVQQHRRLIRYRIASTDNGNTSGTAPQAEDPQPNFAYFVYDGVPEWRGAIQPASPDPVRSTPVAYPANVMGRLPVYHLISKKTSVEESTWLEKYWGDLYKWNGTLVYDGKVYDHIRYRARGGGWRYAMGKNMWKFDFNRGQDFEPRDNYGKTYKVPWRKLNLGACIQQGDYGHRGEQGMFESVGFRLFNLAGVEAPETHFIHFRIIDEPQEANPTNQYVGDFWGLYLAVEQEDGRFLDQHGLPDGNLYKMEYGYGDLNNQGATGVTDQSDVQEFQKSYSGRPLPEDWWRSHFDLNRYYSYQAIVQGIHHYDICHGKNYFYFLNPNTSLWSVHPWDIDLTWADNMYDAGCGGADEFKNRVQSKPAFKLELQNRFREIRDLLFNEDQTWQLLDEYAAMIDDPKGGLAFVDADRAMWDYNPVMTNGRLVDLGKAGRSKFYQAVPTKDFPGMVEKMKRYVVTRGRVLDNFANDVLIPDQPHIQSTAPANFPVNRLTFEAFPYSGANAFSAMKWRIGEVTLTNSPGFDPTTPRKYEIEPVWESPERTTFAAGITIPTEAVKVGHAYRVRVRMKDETGRWSRWSAAVEFVATAPDAAAAVKNNLQITELMYHPTVGNELEFVELHNASSSLTLDLTGVAFTEGIEYTFPSGATLSPGGYLLVVRASAAANFTAFRAHYRLGTDTPIYGPFLGGLNNDGEQITMETADGGEPIVSFQYGDGRGWPLAADGAGHSLVPLEAGLLRAESGSLNYPGHWRASSYISGSPGQADPTPPAGPVLNEIVAHTDFSSELNSNDWIELFNPTSSSIAFGAGWFLSDDVSDLKKWPIPSGTVLSARSWLVFDEISGFHNPPTAGFGLSKNGEQVCLSYLPGTTADRIVDAISFKAQENEWSLGRSPDGTGFWSPLNPRTRGTANSLASPRVIISELMFHPKPAAVSAQDNDTEEYVELYNPTAAPVNLYSTNGVWRLDGGVEFLFPPNTVVPPDGRLLIVNFSLTNTVILDSFRRTYNITSSIPVVGPYLGKLNNSIDRVALEMSQYADLTNSPPAWVVVDEVIYFDQQPWPSTADGTGLALGRISMTISGNDPTNWRAAIPTPGRGELDANDKDGDAMPDAWETAHGLDPNSAADPSLDLDGDGLTNLQEYVAGTDPADRSNVLQLHATCDNLGTAVLSFTVMAGKRYTIWYCDELANGTWQPLQELTPVNMPKVVSVSDPNPSPAQQRYYRVSVGTGD